MLKAWVTKHVLQQQFGSRPKTVKNTLQDKHPPLIKCTQTHSHTNTHAQLILKYISSRKAWSLYLWYTGKCFIFTPEFVCSTSIMCVLSRIRGSVFGALCLYHIIGECIRMQVTLCIWRSIQSIAAVYSRAGNAELQGKCAWTHTHARAHTQSY